ncbi:MAG: hypothetical protein U9N76_00805, partial [Candidatus Marinimicrobia bacterium]|nr:hypothetical protein [Candidatus Neomarinimicrobiota bacterium]
MKSGKKISCFVTEMNSTAIQLKYNNNKHASGTGLNNVEKVVLGKNKIVYQSDKGYLVNLQTLEQYLSKRKDIREKKLITMQKQIQKKKEMKIAQTTKNPLTKMRFNMKYHKKGNWSFGANYIPQFNLNVYMLDYYNPFPYAEYYYSIVKHSFSTPNIDGQFTWKISQKLGLTFSVSYLSDFDKERYEDQRNYDDGDSYEYGHVNTNDLQIFSFNLGFKYYLSEMAKRKVSPYIIIGAGKQIASVTEKSIGLFDGGSSSDIIEDNEEEFLEKINSPFNINGGFGVEYAFNKSLSLFSNIQIFYSTVEATYTYRKIHNSDYPYYAYSQKIDRVINTSNTYTRIGLGLNFYF